MKYGIAIIISLIVASVVYFLNPDQQIPMHFNFEGEADQFGEKASVFMNTLFVGLISVFFFLAETNKKARDEQKRVLSYLFYIVMFYMVFGPLYNLYLSKVIFGKYQAISPMLIFTVVIGFVVYYRKELKKT